MTDERDEMICFAEDDEIAWRQWLVDFRAKVWPMFEEQGFSFPEAALLWRLEGVTARLQQLLDKEL